MPKFKFSDIAFNITKKRKPTIDDMETYIGLEHLDTGSLAVTRWGSKVPIKGDKLIMEKGDILFGKRNAYLKRAAIAPHDGLFSAHGMILRPNEEVISPKLFPFFICSDYFFDAAIRISVGSLSPTINWSALKELEFILPDMEEQEKLAELLWAANNTKEAYKKLLFLTDELVKARFVEMFGTWENSEYEVKVLEDLCEPIKDGTHQTPTYTDDKEKGFKFLSSKNVTSGYIDWSDIKYIPPELHEKLYARISPRRNDILLAKNGTTGICAIVETDEIFDIYVSLALLRFLPGNNIKFMWSAINLPQTKAQFDANLKGIGVPNLHLGEIKKTKIVVPPIELQDKFAAFVEQTDKSKFELKENIYKLEKTIKALMAKTFG